MSQMLASTTQDESMRQREAPKMFLTMTIALLLVLIAKAIHRIRYGARNAYYVESQYVGPAESCWMDEQFDDSGSKADVN